LDSTHLLQPVVEAYDMDLTGFQNVVEIWKQTTFGSFVYKVKYTIETCFLLQNWTFLLLKGKWSLRRESILGQSYKIKRGEMDE
jgi:hypothetical protein